MLVRVDMSISRWVILVLRVDVELLARLDVLDILESWGCGSQIA
jgi:hypothetical protein